MNPREAGVDEGPLILDLDGTLLKTDLLLESLVGALKKQPWCLPLLAWWLMRGRAVLKRGAADRAGLRVDLLPLNMAVVDYATRSHAGGRVVHIATAADASLAHQVAQRLGFVGEVMASDGRGNLKAAAKARMLADRFPDGFSYVGDSWADVDVWRAARTGVFAGRSRRVEAAAGRAAPLVASFMQDNPSLRCWLRALRIHQWAKNALVFVPMFLAGRAGDASSWIADGLGFLAIGVMSSSTYLINDMWDLEDDRQHRSKKHRPLASGSLPLAHAMIAAPLGILAGAALAYAAGGLAALGCVLVYLAGTLIYSLGLKRVPIADTLVIGGLFTLRLWLGAVLVEAPLKQWLFVFSAFLFTSLAMAKRLSEIRRVAISGASQVNGRGYLAVDAPVVSTMGIGASVAAVLVMVLYLVDEAFQQNFYRSPAILFAIPVALTLWLGRIWLLCGRDELDDDPVAFAVKDKPSLWLAAFVAGVLAAAVFL